MRLQPKTTNRFLITTALTAIFTTISPIAKADPTPCTNTIGDFVGNCQIPLAEKIIQ